MGGVPLRAFAGHQCLLRHLSLRRKLNYVAKLCGFGFAVALCKKDTTPSMRPRMRIPAKFMSRVARTLALRFRLPRLRVEGAGLIRTPHRLLLSCQIPLTS